MQRRMLSKEDEAATGSDDTEVRREDQDKINRFSRLHSRESMLEEELRMKHKDKEDLDEVSNELELTDEDDLIPYKIGDSFISLPLPEVQSMLSSSTERIDEEVSALEEKLGGIREEMQQLKVALYARFGRRHALPDLTQPNQGKRLGAQEGDVHREMEVKEPMSAPSSGMSSPNSKRVICFGQGDPANPFNWSTRKKSFVVLVGIVTVINSTLGSALPSGAIPFIALYFNITDEQQLVLPISMYLVGYVLGPLLFGPLSETYGRKKIMTATFCSYTILTMACALGPNWPALLVFRLLVGINAACPVSVVGGLYADIFSDPVTRGRAMAMFMAATTFGPLLGPIISGYISVLSWRWTFWVGFIIAGVSIIPLLFLPETYGPVILKKYAQQMRKATGNPNIVAPIELEKKGAKQMVTVTLMRPIRMLLFEAIVLFSCLYLSLAYAIFYMFFEAYPIIFQGIYRMRTGVSALPFIPIGVGAVLACGTLIYYDSILQRAKARNAPWSSIEEYRRLPLACIGGPLYIISLFWLGWSASPHIHWIVPTLAGLPFGIGFLLIFMALINYLADAYQIYAASALAASSCCRSIFGAVLPLAAKPMFDRLGVCWACSLLGFISLGMTIIPFAFIKYGDRIRARSKFCQELLARKSAMQKSEGGEEYKECSREEAVEKEEV